VLRAVLFDLDDTLVDHDSAAAAALLAWALERGVAVASIRSRWASLSEFHYTRYQRGEVTFRGQGRARIRGVLQTEMSDREADEAYSIYLTHYEANWSLFGDAIGTLRRARGSGLIVAVLTNGDHDHQRLKLEKLGIDGDVDFFIASSTLSVGKPDPRAFLGALARIGVGCAEALMIGNSLTQDVRGALSVGVDAILLDRHDAYAGTGIKRVRTLDELDFEELSRHR
jgi:putative hydrolase of the HAD superfamily